MSCYKLCEQNPVVLLSLTPFPCHEPLLDDEPVVLISQYRLPLLARRGKAHDE